MSLLAMFIFLLIFIAILFGLDLLFIRYQMDCDEHESIMQCITAMIDNDEPTPAQGSVTATGGASGKFAGQEGSITVEMSFPLEGGDVVGTFSGDCDGKISGTFAGGNGGAISGTGKGSCGYVFPASGSFSGTVNTASKSVPISGQGRASGVNGSGSITLTY